MTTRTRRQAPSTAKRAGAKPAGSKPAKPPAAKPVGVKSAKSAKPAKPAGAKPAKRGAAPRVYAGPTAADLSLAELEALRGELESRRAELIPRWNADPDDVKRSVAQLVLALVEFLRRLIERQAIRRMEAETLTPEEIERIGLALMRLESTLHEMAAQFGLSPEELNLDLGPLGRLS